MIKLLNIIILISIFIFANTIIKGQIQRCGTPDPPKTVKANSLYTVQTNNVKQVPVILHVIYKSDGIGNISDSQLLAQVETLNAAHTRIGSPYSFYLAAITRTQSNQWFNIARGSQAETDMTNALAIDPKHIFNVYVLNADPYLGWVINWPWDVSEDSRQNGVIIHNGSVPGGYLTDFNLGYTLVHEGGHYFGLYHTFQNGCNSPGDEVDDTPYEAYAASGCPDPNPDTCPQDGIDPIHNYMDYSNDPCMNHFTSGQKNRISSIMGQYRPNLGGTTLTVPIATTLNIYTDTKVEFPLNFSLQVFGTLNAANVVFDRIGSTGNWGGIVFNSGSIGSLNYCNINHGIYGITCNGVLPSITNCTFRYYTIGIKLNNVGTSTTHISGNYFYGSGSSQGIACYYSSPQIDGVIHDYKMQYNGIGIFCLGSSPTISNLFFMNSTNSVYLLNHSYATVGPQNRTYLDGNAIYADDYSQANVFQSDIYPTGI